MIADIFNQVIFFFVSGLINMFPPSEGFPADAEIALTTLGGYFGMFEPLIPMGTLITCLTLIFGVEIGIYGFRTLKWVISHLPFVGGRG